MLSMASQKDGSKVYGRSPVQRGQSMSARLWAAGAGLEAAGAAAAPVRLPQAPAGRAL